MQIVVTAGPTRERIDRVRYLSNFSSGKMGFEVAVAARDRGHRVTLVAGPTSLTAPRGVRVVSVESAREMLAAVRKPFAVCDALIMTAAVADYRPARRLPGKLRKKEGPLDLRLVRNPDILGTLGPRKGNRIVIGFALEPGLSETIARRKMVKKNMDGVVLNDPETLASDRIRCTLLQSDGTRIDWGNKTKKQTALQIVRLVESLDRASRG